jgi:hypothetical protein
MSATSLGSMWPIERHPAVGEEVSTALPKTPAIVTPQLEEFMRQICDLVDNHPEWVHQSQPERMKNFLSAVREL